MKDKNIDKERETEEKEVPQIFGDLNRLVEFIRVDGPISVEDVIFKFGWSPAKSYSLLRVALKKYADIFKNADRKFISKGKENHK